ncbi:hypothetical protein [Polycyclovorans algicola]|uniref:hypothetical protein n=1 Tax=Polycyclovorans algicola TaxID=616992 RepID=UPI0004A71958|nr:hypothetical protein [Polycyclovorans algicola]
MRLTTLGIGALMPWAVWAVGLDYLSGADNMLKYAALPVTSVDSAQPQAMITLSKDHTLFFKAYNDFTDLNGDGVIETTYNHSFIYYGYFDSFKCYSYSSDRFVPANRTEDKYCNNQWSGNFLNWASMTRIDVVRKILFGGARSIDDSTAAGGGDQNLTVLQRTYLPNDAHSFAKYYNGPDIAKLTPFTDISTNKVDKRENGITLCNTTVDILTFSKEMSPCRIFALGLSEE